MLHLESLCSALAVAAKELKGWDGGALSAMLAESAAAAKAASGVTTTPPQKEQMGSKGAVNISAGLVGMEIKA